MGTRFTFGLLALGALATTATARAESVDKFTGEPAVTEGKQIGAFGWQDKDGGLHLRVTTPFRKAEHYAVTGTVCAVAKEGKNLISTLTPRFLEPEQDRAWIGPKGHCVWFTFKTNGHIDGFDFTTPAKALLFTIKVDGELLATDKIHIGAKGLHPEKNPMLLVR